MTRTEKIVIRIDELSGQILLIILLKQVHNRSAKKVAICNKQIDENMKEVEKLTTELKKLQQKGNGQCHSR